MPSKEEGKETIEYRKRVNADGRLAVRDGRGWVSVDARNRVAAQSREHVGVIMKSAEATRMGMNRTGAHISSKETDRMIKGAEEGGTPVENGAAIAAVRTSYIAEADPVGTVPPPTTKAAARTGMKKMAGKSPEVFIDKLGERLAFERSGVRLYEALLTKYQAMPEKVPAMSVDQLTHFRDEEALHFKWVADALETLGADPTAQTPGADIAGVESMGIMQVLSDPRTTISQSLHALLLAELADNAGWELLIKLADDLGQDKMASFKQALKEEREHRARAHLA